MQNQEHTIVNEAHVYKIIEKLEELIPLNDENTPTEIKKLTETLNAQEQEYLLDKLQSIFYYCCDPGELTEERLISAFFLFKIKGD